MSAPPTILVFIDADACPVKDEVYKVSGRHGVRTVVVSNSYMQLPRDPLIERVIVGAGLDIADDYIAERARRGVVVITADIPLAARCIRAGADVIAPDGRAHTEQSIGMALATRNLMDDLRSAGQITGGPRAFAAKDRSKFLSALDLAIVRLKRAGLQPEG
ncbi:MAG: YaiI/YqxD family protein [Beijerinckiaceae bacterium]|nr:YaiI/YqxD family protein [Beijerinckiaceae bacterium]